MTRGTVSKELVAATVACAVGVAVMFEITGTGLVAGLFRPARGATTGSGQDAVATARPAPRPHEALAAFLRRRGLRPQVADNGGSRTLLVVGDVHNVLKRGDLYVAFLEEVARELPMAALFMEGVYAGEEQAEPYLAYWMDVERVKQGRALYPGRRDALREDQRQRDPAGYFRLSRRFRVVGLETPATVAKAVALSRAHDYVRLLCLNGEVSRRVERRVNQFARAAATELFPSRNCPPRMSPAQHHALIARARDARDAVTLRQRNAEFVERIDRELADSELGALLVGRAHVEPPEHRKHHGSIRQGLRERKINWVYVDVFQVRRCVGRRSAGPGS